MQAWAPGFVIVNNRKVKVQQWQLQQQQQHEHEQQHAVLAEDHPSSATAVDSVTAAGTAAGHADANGNHTELSVQQSGQAVWHVS